MQLVMYGNPITKKNSSRLFVRNGKPMILPSKKYTEYEAECLQQLPYVDTIDYPCNVKCNYYMKTKRKVDLVNLLEATLDILVKAKVIEDDNCSIVASHDGCRVNYDKDNPRVEIYIRRLIDEE